jgi:molybdopterin-biosynthesis enzyme MoeA-like protein
MAGVPRIMQSMFDAILPTLTGGKPVESRSVTADLPESVVADELAVIQSNYGDVSIGSYPQYKNGRFGVCLVLRGIDEGSLSKATQDVVNLVKAKGEDNPIVT